MRLSGWGHQVTVVTAVPNYPQGRVFDGYRKHLIYEEGLDGIRILRARIYVSTGRAFMPRMMSYASFMFAAIVLAIAKAGTQDLILVESPPLSVGMSGLVLKAWFRAKMVLNVSDLWPESAVAMGMLHSRCVIRAAIGLEEMLYRRSSLVIGQTRHIVSEIARRTGVRTELISNGIDTGAFADPGLVDRSARRTELGFGDEFVVGYAGLLGFAQGIDVILRAAKHLEGRPGILFALFGDGPEKARLVDQARRQGLENVRFFPPQPKSRIPTVMACFDASIVPLRDLRIFRGAIPCKLFESMAAGTPIILSIAGEAEDLVRDANGGICIPPEDAHALADAVLRLKDDPVLRRTLARNARSYIVRNYNRLEIAAKLQSLLLPLVEQTGRQCMEDLP